MDSKAQHEINRQKKPEKSHEKKHEMTVIKRGVFLSVILLAILTVCIGCGMKEENQIAVRFAASLDVVAAEARTPEDADEPKSSFKVTYQGQESCYEIELRHCECLYDADNMQIYAEYLYREMVPDSFPSNQYVIYIRTPREELQLYPVKDFLVDEEYGILYTKIVENDGFERIKSLFFLGKDGHILDSEREILHSKEAEKMLCSAYIKELGNEPDAGQALFSNITIELNEVGTDGAGTLKGEVGATQKTTGQQYYADWKFDMADGALTMELCVLKQYDPLKNQEEFAACSKIYDEIEQGDWSNVKPIKEEYLWEMEADEWTRMDANGDGLPELVGGYVIDELPEYEDERKIQISVIFAYQDGMAEIVYLDVNDGMEFLFITAKGKLVYEWGVSGSPCTNVFRLCRFDLKWKKEYLDTLVRYRFVECEEDEAEYYREFYPDTYGVGGSGIYYLRDRLKTEEELRQNTDGKYVVREYLTEEEFLEVYEEMTGWDFYKAQFMY